MSDLNFDLNIHNYTLQELENLIKLNSTYNYSEITLQSNLLKQQIFGINTISQHKKIEITNFIKDIINALEKNFIQKKLHLIIAKQTNLDEKLNKIIDLLNIYKNNL